MTKELSTEIKELAQSYYENYATKELETMLKENLWKLRDKSSAATRGSDFWKKFKERLLKETLQNRDTFSVAIGFATSQAMNQLQSAGLDLVAYRIVIALIVALVVRSAFGALDPTQKP